MDSSDSDDDLDLVLIAAHERPKRRREFWVHPILAKRKEQGEFHHLFQELKLYPKRFKEAFRLSVVQFEDVLRTVGPHLQRQRTNFREPIEPEQRLAVCLRYSTNLY